MAKQTSRRYEEAAPVPGTIEDRLIVHKDDVDTMINYIRSEFDVITVRVYPARHPDARRIYMQYKIRRGE
jgi:hypothetical protein